MDLARPGGLPGLRFPLIAQSLIKPDVAKGLGKLKALLEAKDRACRERPTAATDQSQATVSKPALTPAATAEDQPADRTDTSVRLGEAQSAPRRHGRATRASARHPSGAADRRPDRPAALDPPGVS